MKAKGSNKKGHYLTLPTKVMVAGISPKWKGYLRLRGAKREEEDPKLVAFSSPTPKPHERINKTELEDHKSVITHTTKVKVCAFLFFHPLFPNHAAISLLLHKVKNQTSSQYPFSPFSYPSFLSHTTDKARRFCKAYTSPFWHLNLPQNFLLFSLQDIPLYTHKHTHRYIYI